MNISGFRRAAEALGMHVDSLVLQSTP